jgi:hypothetical protein
MLGLYNRVLLVRHRLSGVVIRRARSRRILEHFD